MTDRITAKAQLLREPLAKVELIEAIPVVISHMVMIIRANVSRSRFFEELKIFCDVAFSVTTFLFRASIFSLSPSMSLSRLSSPGGMELSRVLTEILESSCLIPFSSSRISLALEMALVAVSPSLMQSRECPIVFNKILFCCKF